MRFFTTLERAGRLEYFLVSVVLSIAYYGLFYGVLDFRVNETAFVEDPSFTDFFSYNAALFPIFLIGAAAIFFFSIINTCRRLKDMNKSFALVLLLFIPIVGAIFSLFLLFAKGERQQTYAPYGDNPYDPQSWVPPTAANSGPAVSYRGEDLYLPGEGVAAPEQFPGEQAA